MGLEALTILEHALKDVVIRSLGDCTINEMVELWNSGFAQYVTVMNITPVRMIAKLGQGNIHPECSVTAWIGGKPAGFVMIGLRETHGTTYAWNGGSGVSPAYRGRSLSKLLLNEAIRRTRDTGALIISLETRTDNEIAIRAYRSCGFEFVDTMHDFKRFEPFEAIPFRRADRFAYTCLETAPGAVGKLSFYPLNRISWTTQWFNTVDYQAMLAYDGLGRTVGYAVYRRTIGGDGRFISVELTQCEADPSHSDAPDIVRFLLAQVMGPPELQLHRSARYMRGSNPLVLEALREAGFGETLSEHLMTLKL